MPNFRDGELSKVEPKVFRQFVISMAGWIVMLMACYFVFISTLGGEDLPFYLQNTRIVEGPDTNYARTGFQQLLDRPVPSHVSQIYFRDQSSIVDEHQTLHFTTTEPSFIQDLVQEYKLEQRHGGFTEGEGDYGDHYRTLFYNRDTGEVIYMWITN